MDDAAPATPAAAVGHSIGRPLSQLLRERLRESAAPVLMAGPRTLPGASLWTAARSLVRDLRCLGMRAGDVLLLCTEDDLLAACGLVAGVTGGFPVALVPPPLHLSTLAGHAEALSARLALVSPDDLDRRTPPGEVPSWVVPAGLAGLLAHPAAGNDPRAATPSGVRTRDDHDDRRARDDQDGPTPDIAAFVGAVEDPGRWQPLTEHDVSDRLERLLSIRFGGLWVRSDGLSRPAGVVALPHPLCTGAHTLEALASLVSAEVLLSLPAAEGVNDEPGARAGQGFRRPHHPAHPTGAHR